MTKNSKSNKGDSVPKALTSAEKAKLKAVVKEARKNSDNISKGHFKEI